MDEQNSQTSVPANLPTDTIDAVVSEATSISTAQSEVENQVIPDSPIDAPVVETLDSHTSQVETLPDAQVTEPVQVVVIPETAPVVEAVLPVVAEETRPEQIAAPPEIAIELAIEVTPEVVAAAQESSVGSEAETKMTADGDPVTAPIEAASEITEQPFASENTHAQGRTFQDQGTTFEESAGQEATSQPSVDTSSPVASTPIPTAAPEVGYQFNRSLPANVTPEQARVIYMQRLAKGRVTTENRKQRHFAEIMQLFETKQRITRRDVEELTRISDTSAGRYLSRLEKLGKVQQVGTTGPKVFYVKLS
jgi:hypothetical protein